MSLIFCLLLYYWRSLSPWRSCCMTIDKRQLNLLCMVLFQFMISAPKKTEEQELKRCIHRKDNCQPIYFIISKQWYSTITYPCCLFYSLRQQQLYIKLIMEIITPKVYYNFSKNLDSIIKWCKINRVSLNYNYCKIIIFSRNHS